MKKIGRDRRHKRIAKTVRGTGERPRMVVFRSKKNILVQLVDDSIQKVIVGFSTLGKDFKGKNIKSSDINGAKEIGKMMASKAVELGFKNVCFDRGGYKYHGRVKSLAEGAREGGLLF
ncbi:MAG: 50S ribosomal protein L18 [Candidatus Omnitrophica bacterium]|nr:50S ribosomal protein L18 [Candidatus Omnitrophota bacterium]MCK5288667.1 50S ribosomal protein L18 [Candidatus Omnitrophota bacterium]